MRNLLQLLFILLLYTFNIIAQEFKTGTITGQVIDRNTKEPLIAANVILIGTNYGASTDENGFYRIENVPVGSYSIKFSYIGYLPLVKSDIIVKSKRIINVNAELETTLIESSEVVVSGGYFSKTEVNSISAMNFAYEEIRRAPGAAGDISRIIMSLPSVAKVNDQSNGLIVRGGSPIENAFYIDNIEIPNINHFPTLGTTNGPIGLINLEFVEDVTFYAGGFDVTYGDKLSSVMNVKFREGNKEDFDFQVDLNWAGLGGVAEGPISLGNGFWMFSIRRSYLDLLIKTLDMGTNIAPNYGDYQGKVVFELDKNNKLSFIGILGDDHNKPDKQTAIDNDMLAYGRQDIYTGTIGMTWQSIWKKKGFSVTTLSYTGTKFNEIFYETGTEQLLLSNKTFERFIKLRNINHYKLDSLKTVDFGFEIKYLFDTYDNLYGEYVDAIGNPTPSKNITKI